MTPGPSRFHTTHWSVVLAAADGTSPQAEAALAALCETYWHPVYAFIRRSGRSEDDARDLTQAFFARVIERRDLRTARPERGRFRSFLLAAVRHFMSDERDHDMAKKRGGGSVHIPIGAHLDDEAQAVVDPATDETPEQVYERRWALSALDAAVARAAAEYRRAGRSLVFETLSPSIRGEDKLDYEHVSRTLGCSEGAARVAAHRVRRHIGACLRAALLETVANPADVDDELRFLMAALERPRAPRG